MIITVVDVPRRIAAASGLHIAVAVPGRRGRAAEVAAAEVCAAGGGGRGGAGALGELGLDAGRAGGGEGGEEGEGCEEELHFGGWLGLKVDFDEGGGLER